MRDIPEIQTLLPLCDFPSPGTAVECAVSGGADSTALMVLAKAAGCDVTAVHVDHGLREGSHLEAKIVQKNCELLGVKFRSERVSIEPGGNLEARARQARYSVLSENVCTGHTADDQAETILLNLIRGTGVAGLAGMEPNRKHPILRLRRRDTETVCNVLGLEIVHDPSNDELDFRRNKIRHLVVPLLSEIAERDVVPLLNRSADHARETHELLVESTKREVGDPTDVQQLRSVSRFVAQTALYQWLLPHVSEGKTLDKSSIDRVMMVVDGYIVGTQLPGGAMVKRTRNKLRIEKYHEDVR